jgi:dissimilatory sulfite reductase (desulfoviridin) alpha/beta subunit
MRDGMTYREIGEVLGISGERVRMIAATSGATRCTTDLVKCSEGMRYELLHQTS